MLPPSVSGACLNSKTAAEMVRTESHNAMLGLCRRPELYYRKRQQPSTLTLMKMNYYADKWKLDASVCPTDAHFNEWIDHKKIRNKTIFNFSSGNHLVGPRQAARRNRTLCITASRQEYDTYILTINNVAVGRSYRCYFGAST